MYKHTLIFLFLPQNMSKWDHKTPSAVIHSPQNAQKMLFSDDLCLRHLALLIPATHMELFHDLHQSFQIQKCQELQWMRSCHFL